MIHIKGKKTAIVLRMMTMAEQTKDGRGSIPCACCNIPAPYEGIDYLTAYIPTDPIIISRLQPGLGAGYFICKKCSRDLSEEEVFQRAQKCLIEQHKLLEHGHAPLDSGGRHRHKNVKSILGDTSKQIIDPTAN